MPPLFNSSNTRFDYSSRCTDGIVIGTDSGITHLANQYPTIIQPIQNKIEVIQDELIVTGTGQIGHGQRFTDIIKQHWGKKEFREKSIIDIGRILSNYTINDFKKTFSSIGVYGALVAIPCGCTVELIEFQFADFQPEIKTIDHWYVSMGWGQPIADTLLRFFREIWGNEPPNYKMGICVVTMVLKLSCKMSPNTLTEPIQIAVLSSKNGGLCAFRLSENELSEYIKNFDDSIKYLKEYFHNLQSSN